MSKDIEEGHLLIENVVNIYFFNLCIGIVAQSSRLLLLYMYIYIKSMRIYQPENLMSNGSSRHDDAAQAK
jgi:hypothetical protein